VPRSKKSRGIYPLGDGRSGKRMMLQLNPPLWVNTPLGEGHAIIVIDYGVSVNTIWVVHIFETGIVTHIDSSEIRMMGNEMYGIPHPEKPKRSMNK
jgi:hypothetical protein